MRLLVTSVLGLGLVASLLAAAPDVSLRPVVRAEGGLQAPVRPKLRNAVILPSALDAEDVPKRPKLRAASEQDVQLQRLVRFDTGVVLAAASLRGPQASLLPHARPDGLTQKVMAKRRARKRGAVCGSVDIQGDVVGMVPGRIKGCGIKDAVKVKSVSGVALSTPALMDCKTAKALNSWIVKGAKPAVGQRGGGLSTIKVAAHYACRTRNNRPGAKISEHGRGRAIDISAFRLNDGSSLSVLKDWRSARGSSILKRMHRAACGPFGTVLGPQADRYHQDHFHFDTARYRSGSYCR